MKKGIALTAVLILFSALSFGVSAQSNADKTMTKKEVKKWFAKQEWLGGVQLKPHKSVDVQVFARQYQLNKKYWDEAFAFIKNNDLEKLAKGKYPIDGEHVFASITEDATKDFDKTNWESHRNYIDLQYIIEGEEKIGVSPVAKATVTKPYNEKHDAANYTADGKIYSAVPGTFFLFFPSDAHRPSITPGGNKVVKKLVIKIEVASSNGITTSLQSFPDGATPQQIGKRIAERFVSLPHSNFNRTTPPRVITYPETCTWYGALTFAKETNDKNLTAQLVQRFEPLFGSQDSLIPTPDHVDYTVFGAVPLELYIQTKEPKYLDLGKYIADKQWGPPEGKRVKEESHRFYNKGLTWQTRLWIDDMFMITAVQAQAYRATGDQKYIDRAAKGMGFYLDSLQRPNGLFYHAPDVPFFWGRGDGWMAAGMSELLRSLPKDNPDRPRIMDGYKKMMASLLKYQAEDGMWRQLIDDPASWKETSCSGMFTFAFITGVKEGWLDAKTYGPAARKGWLSVIKYINADNDVTEICEGTNKKNDRQYYLDRKRNVGDLHGHAPILWCATALLR